MKGNFSLTRRHLLRLSTTVQRPFWLSVEHIRKKCTDGSWLTSDSLKVVKPGDWDRCCVAIEEVLASPKYRSVFQHFKSGIDWSETELFQEYRNQIEKKGRLGKHRSIDSLVAYYKSTYDVLYREIAVSGLQAPSILKPHIRPMFVHIDRHGDVMWTTEGNHRLAIALCLGVQRIPVYLFWRHDSSPNGMERWEL